METSCSRSEVIATSYDVFTTTSLDAVVLSGVVLIEVEVLLNVEKGVGVQNIEEEDDAEEVMVADYILGVEEVEIEKVEEVLDVKVADVVEEVEVVEAGENVDVVDVVDDDEPLVELLLNG